MKPELREKSPETLGEIPFAPAYKAGLVTKNCSWSSEKPVLLNDKCNGCLLCFLYCPDGVIKKDGGKVSFDYDFCKGCGICKKICNRHAIEFESKK